MGRTFSGEGGWWGHCLPLHKVANSSGFKMNASLLLRPAICYYVLRGERWWGRSPSSEDAPSLAGVSSTKERVLLARRGPPDTGGEPGHGWVLGKGGWAPRVHMSFPAEPGPVVGTNNQLSKVPCRVKGVPIPGLQRNFLKHKSPPTTSSVNVIHGQVQPDRGPSEPSWAR